MAAIRWLESAWAGQGEAVGLAWRDMPTQPITAPCSTTTPPGLPVVLVLASGRGDRFVASGGQVHKLRALLAGVPVLEHTLAAVRASGLPWHLEDAGHPGMGDSIAAEPGGRPRRDRARQAAIHHAATCLRPVPYLAGRWRRRACGTRARRTQARCRPRAARAAQRAWGDAFLCRKAQPSGHAVPGSLCGARHGGCAIVLQYQK